jgi:hypothetical protein
MSGEKQKMQKRGKIGSSCIELDRDNFVFAKRITSTFIRKVALISTFLLCSKFNAILAQSINFSVTPNTDLGLVYQTGLDFETERTIPRAFRLAFGAANLNLAVNAKVISTLNYGTELLSSDFYSIRLSNANTNVNNKFRRLYQLDFADQTILEHRGSNRGGSVYYDYDLIVAPVGYDIEPGQYFYSIVFTLSPQ